MARKSKKKKHKEANSAVLNSKSLSTFPVQWLCGLLIVMTVAASWTPHPVSHHLFYKSFIGQVGVLLFLSVWLWTNKGPKQIQVHLSASRLLLGALFCLATCSVIWAVSFDFFVFKWLMWLAGFAAFLLAINVEQTRDAHEKIAMAVVLCGTFISLHGIIQYLFDLDIPFQNAGPASTFSHRNMAAQIVVLCFPFSFYLISLSKRGESRIIALASVPLMITYIFYTGTRAAWAAISVEFIFAAVIFLMYKQHLTSSVAVDKQKIKIGAGMLLAVLVLINLSAGFEKFGTFIDTFVSRLMDTESFSLRLIIWEDALEMVKQNPVIGSGLGGYYYINNTAEFDQYTTSSQRVHNDYLELLVELGSIGLLLLLAFGISLFIQFTRILKNASDDLRLFYFFLGVALAGAMSNALFSFPYQLTMPIMIFCIYLALMIKGSDSIENNKIENNKIENSKKVIDVKISRRSMQGTSAGVSVVLVLVCWLNMQWWSDFNDMLGRTLYNKWDKSPMTFDAFAHHQDYYQIGMGIAQVFLQAGHYQSSINVLLSMRDFWPEHIRINTRLAESYMRMGRIEPAKKHAEIAESHVTGGEFTPTILLMQIAFVEKDHVWLAEMYERMTGESEENLSSKELTSNRIHFFAVASDNIDDVERFYNMHQQHKPDPAMEERHALYFVQKDRVDKAVVAMEKYLELKPDTQRAAYFRALLNKQSALPGE